MKKCPYCGYEWKPRVKTPKRCPFCNRWLPEWKEVRKIEAERK